MLPTAADSGATLAAILPTLRAKLASGQLRGALICVVDGLGWVNLRSNRSLFHAFEGFRARRITTVAPSTTASALTTITTGKLPGQHGLLGYRILNPETDNLTGVLKQWDEIHNQRAWQRQSTEFEALRAAGVPVHVYARVAHQHSGFTRAVLTGADYNAHQTIADRFAAAMNQLRTAGGLAYVYIDELDKAGHDSGSASSEWGSRAQMLNQAIADACTNIASDIGLVITADHGMIDIPSTSHRLIEAMGAVPEDARVAGEPRFRYLYLRDPESASAVVEAIKRAEGGSCYVGTRDEWVASGVFGDVDPEVLPRLGDVMFSSRRRIAYMTDREPSSARQMVGQHGGFDDDERGVPLLVAGALSQSDFD